MKNKQTKTAKKRESSGERIAAQFNVDAPACPMAFRRRLAANIDRAIRAAVKKERYRIVAIMEREKRSAYSDRTCLGAHAACCINACIKEIGQ